MKQHSNKRFHWLRSSHNQSICMLMPPPIPTHSIVLDVSAFSPQFLVFSLMAASCQAQAQLQVLIIINPFLHFFSVTSKCNRQSFIKYFWLVWSWDLFSLSSEILLNPFELQVKYIIYWNELDIVDLNLVSVLAYLGHRTQRRQCCHTPHPRSLKSEIHFVWESGTKKGPGI